MKHHYTMYTIYAELRTKCCLTVRQDVSLNPFMALILFRSGREVLEVGATHARPQQENEGVCTLSTNLFTNNIYNQTLQTTFKELQIQFGTKLTCNPI